MEQAAVSVRIGCIALVLVFLKVFPTTMMAQEIAFDLAASAENDARLLQALPFLVRAKNQVG